MSKENLLQLLILLLISIAALCLLVYPAHGAVSTKHGSSLGIPMYDENPLMYLAGSLATDKAVTEIDGNLNLRIKPLGTYMLFDEAVLLCGMPVDMFQGITEPFVLTYERTAHRSVQGIGCHVLVHVNSLKEEKLK